MSKTETSNRTCIIKLIADKRTKSFRRMRNCAEGKIELSLSQIQANESLLRLAMLFSESGDKLTDYLPAVSSTSA